MTKLLSHLLAAAFATSALGACVTLERPAAPAAVSEDRGLYRFVSAKQRRARALEANGRLAEALMEWRYVSAVAPGDDAARRKILRLKRVIGERAAAYLRRADAAWRKNRKREARLFYLKVLALDGTNRRALRRLRELERAIVLAGQMRKDEAALAEYRAKAAPRSAPKTSGSAPQKKMATVLRSRNHRKASAPVKQRPADPKVDSPTQRLLRARIAKAREIQASGDIRRALKDLEAVSEMPGAKEAGVDDMVRRMRKKIAAQLYAEGLKQMNSNLDRAVELLTESLNFDPRHLGAHRRLAQAKRMRDSLKSIK